MGREHAEMANLSREEPKLLERALHGRIVGMALDLGVELRLLEARGIMNRKGFPESYDRARLVRFLAAIKSGADVVAAPVYSHQRYDIVPEARHTVRHPDIVIVEGLNVLQAPGERAEMQVFASDFFDFTIYVDADEADIERWYVERFLRLRDTVFQDPQSYFHRYGSIGEAEAREARDPGDHPQ